MRDPRFYCSRTKLGAHRVFYVVWRYDELHNEDRKLLAYGYAGTIAEAEKRGRTLEPCTVKRP
jgi:hypothetical protein